MGVNGCEREVLAYAQPIPTSACTTAMLMKQHGMFFIFRHLVRIGLRLMLADTRASFVRRCSRYAASCWLVLRLSSRSR